MAKDFSLTKYFREQYINEFKSNSQKETDAMRSSTFTAYDEDGEQPYLNEKSIEDYRRVSAPRAKKDKNNPNFLNVFIDYDIGPGGATMAFGQETMTGQIRRLSSERARLIMNNIAVMLQDKYDIEDIEVTDLENGKVKLFAVSDDFIDMKGDEFGDFGLPGNLKEIDINDPALVKARAAKDQINKLKSNPKPNFDEVLDLRDEKGDLERRIKNLYREMESDPDVEAEGGAVADQYGDELNKLEARLSKIKKQINQYDMNESLNEALNPEVSRKVNSFIKAMAKRYNYSEQDAVFAIMAALKQRMMDDIKEGSCGYTPDGKPRSKPASSDLMELKEKIFNSLKK